MGEIRDKIAAAKDIESEVVKIDEWDVEIEVRAMNVDDYSKLLSDASNDEGKVDTEKYTPAMVIACCYEVVDEGEDAVKIFTSNDMAMIRGKSSKPIQKLMKVINKLNGTGKDEETAIGKN